MRIGTALAAAAALVLAAGTPHVASQGSLTIAIDVDVAGNGARTVATIEDCALIDSSGTNALAVDIVLPAPGIPADLGIKGWQFDLLYDKSVVTVTKEDREFLLAQAEGSNITAFSLSDPVPDNDGRFTSAAVDFSEAYQVEPEGAQEVGPGVIVRFTLAGVAPGTTSLTLDKLKLLDHKPVSDGTNRLPVGTILNASVSVDTPCTEPPPPTVLTPVGSPRPSETPGATTGTPDTTAGTPGTADETPAPGDTPPASGTAGDGSDDLQTPGASTPGSGTPVLGGTPESNENAGGGEQSDGDGGLSGAAWAGIGLGIAAAAVAAAGGGWYALRRGKAGSE